jgi:hypothetical protein
VAAIAAQPRAWYPYHGLGTALLNEGSDTAAAVPWLEKAAARHAVSVVEGLPILCVAAISFNFLSETVACK